MALRVRALLGTLRACSSMASAGPTAEHIAANIRESTDKHGGEFAYDFGDGTAMKIEYEVDKLGDERVLVLTHTFTPDEHRGQGYAGVLAKQVFDTLLASNTRVVPQCTYLAHFVTKHPEYSKIVVRP